MRNNADDWQFAGQLVTQHGKVFRIWQDVAAKGGRFKVTDLAGERLGFAGTLAKAWSSVRYQAGIIERSQRTED